MATVDLAFEEWKKEITSQEPQTFHAAHPRLEPAAAFRLQLCRMAFAAGRKAEKSRAKKGGE